MPVFLQITRALAYLLVLWPHSLSSVLTLKVTPAFFNLDRGYLLNQRSSSLSLHQLAFCISLCPVFVLWPCYISLVYIDAVWYVHHH